MNSKLFQWVFSIIIVLAVIVAAFVVLRKEAVAPGNGTALPPSPSASPSTSPSATPEPNIVVTSPKAGDKVSNPILVTGRARVFENTFNYILRDKAGNNLYENYAMADAPDTGLFGNFSVKIPIPSGSPADLVVEVFEYSAKDGSVVNLVRVPVTVASRATTKLKAYFTNNLLDPVVSCSKVFSVERTVFKTNEPAYAALIELLRGPTDLEKTLGYATSIPTYNSSRHIRLNSIIIRDGTAYVDFTQELEYQVAGSCRVTAIRAQIESTLKQFSSVKDVVISINGQTEGILQP